MELSVIRLTSSNEKQRKNLDLISLVIWWRRG